MKQYTIIEKDGQKWLRAYHPDEVIYGEPRRYSLMLYLGSRSAGEVVDEREVSLVSQVRPRNIDNIDWVTTCPGKSFTFGLKYVTDLEFRTAYVDVAAQLVDRRPLSEHMHKKHGLILTDDELDDIIALSAYILK